MNLLELRTKYPMYNDMPDEELADAVHGKFYSDMPREDFFGRIDFTPTVPERGMVEKYVTEPITEMRRKGAIEEMRRKQAPIAPLPEEPEVPATPPGYEDVTGMGPPIAEPAEGPPVDIIEPILEFYKPAIETAKVLERARRVGTDVVFDFIESVGRGAGRKLYSTIDPETEDKTDYAEGLYRGGAPIPHEELRDYFVNPAQHGKDWWTPMAPEEADQFIKDRRNLDIAEFLTIVIIAGRGVGRGLQTLSRMIRAKIDFKSIVDKIPADVIKEAQRTGDFSKLNLHSARAWGQMTGGERATILRAKQGFEVKRTVPRFGEAPPPAAEPPPGEVKAVVPTARPRDEMARAATEYQAIRARMAGKAPVPPPKAPVPAVKEPPIARTMAELREIAEKEFPVPRKVEEFPAKPPGLAREVPEVAPREEIVPEVKVGVAPEPPKAPKPPPPKVEVEKPPAKEPWEMGQKEWTEKQALEDAKQFFVEKPTRDTVIVKRNRFIRKQQISLLPKHKKIIETALSEGKPVPKEVLADYPDLGKLRPTTVMEAELRAKKKQWPEGVAPEKMKGGLFAEERKQVGMEFEKPKKVRVQPPPEKVRTFLGWVKSVGGIWDPSLKGEMEEFTNKESGIPFIIRTTGQPFDTLVTQAIEDGWLPEGSTGDNLRSLLRKDIAAMKAKGPREQPITAMEDVKELEKEMAKAGKGPSEQDYGLASVGTYARAGPPVEIPISTKQKDIIQFRFFDVGYDWVRVEGNKLFIPSNRIDEAIDIVDAAVDITGDWLTDPVGRAEHKSTKALLLKLRALKKQPRGFPSVGTYATGEEQYAAPLKAVIDLPELVEIARQLGKGFYPKIVTKIRAVWGKAQGAFAPRGIGRIELKADTFADINQARAVLAHEIGHWIDYLPEKIMTRGNILGRIASLKKYMKHTLPRRPGAKEELTEIDRRRLRVQAQKLIANEYKDKWIDEEITHELPISPTDVLNIWNTVEDALKTNAELYRFVQTLNTAEKKAIVKAALKGQVEERLTGFAKKITQLTGKKIKVEPSAELIAKKYQDLITKEIEKLRLFKRDEIMDELKTLSRTWKPFDPAADPKYTKYRYRPTELYADALSALFNAPGLMRSQAPNFYEGFFNYLEAKPEIKKLYEQIQDDITAGKTDEKLTKRTYEGFRRGDDAYALVLKKKFRFFDALMRDIVDAHWAVIKKVRQVGEKNIHPSKNPRFKLEEMVYSGSEVEWMLGQTVHNIMKPLEDVGIDWDNFGFYRLLKRISSERAEVANPLGWHKDRALAKLKALETEEWKGEKWEAVQKADKAFNEIRKHLLDKSESAGRYDKDFMETMKGNIGDYVTFDVAHYIEKRHGAAPLAKIFPQIGTFQEIANPATATLLKDIVILKAVNRQIAAESITDFLQEHYPKEIRPADTKWNGRFHAIQDPPRGEDLGLVVYLKNGKPKGYYVDKWIADVFDKNPIEGMAIAQILRWTAKPFRMVFTELNPGFWLFNIHRDYFRAAQMIPKAKITTFAKHYAKAIVPALKSTYGIPTDVVNEMLKGNMLISIEGVRGLSPQDKEIERLLARHRLLPPKAWQQKIIKPFGDLFNLYTNIGRAIERMPKIGGYTFLKKRFPDMPPELIGHIVRTRAGSPDFLRLGRAYPIYNNLLLFSNAMKEGYRGDYEAMADRPAEFWWKKTKYIFLPKMLMYAASIGLLGTATKRVYDGVTDYDMANYLVVPLGLTPNGSSVYLRIPTDEGSRLLGGVLMKGLQHDRAKQLSSLFDYMAGQAPTVNPAIENLISVVQYLGGHNPYDAFRGRYAIPEQIFQAHDERSHKAFLKWLANRSGATIVYRFRSDDIKGVNKELEEVLNYPFVSNIVGRFVKVHQAGVREKIKLERALVKTETARKILDAREIMVKFINGDPLTQEDIDILAEKPDSLEPNFVRGMARKYGNVVAAELWSVFQTGTTEEKVRVLSKIVELDAVGRTGKEYRWLWEEEGRKLPTWRKEQPLRGK